METTPIIKNILLPILEKNSKFSEEKVDSAFWKKFATDLIRFEEDAKPLYTAIYSLALDHPEQIIDKLPKIYVQFLKELAECYVLGQTSEAADYLVKTNNKAFLKEVQFLKTMQQAIKSVERKRIIADLPQSYERLTFELSETEIANAIKKKAREELKEKMKKWDVELELKRKPNIFYSLSNESDSKPKVVSLSWIKYAAAACIVITASALYFKFSNNNIDYFSEPSENSVVTSESKKQDKKDVQKPKRTRPAVEAASYSNFQAIIVLEKNVYFQGEQVKGKVVLGRYDEYTKPNFFHGPGRLENGQALISLTAEGVGEHNINGRFTFLEEGKTIPLTFAGKYIVVPRPNSATISADKMNVVYRGVVNPISISFTGISDKNVVASAPGLTKVGNGKYNMNPGAGSEVVINVSGKMADGKMVSDKRVYRIKEIPDPSGTIRGEMGVVKGSKSYLQGATIGAKLVDFDFDVVLDVLGFNFKIEGQPIIMVQGNNLNAQCITALEKADKGDQVTISEIKTKLVGSSLLLPRTAPVIFEIQ